MVKLVDTPASGAGGLTAVEVRVFFWAPISSLRLVQFQDSHKNPRKRVFAFQAVDLFILNQGFTDQIALRIVRHINSGNAEDKCPDGEIGRHASFRCWWPYGRGSSSLLLGTNSNSRLRPRISQKPAKAGFCVSGFENQHALPPVGASLFAMHLKGGALSQTERVIALADREQTCPRRYHP